MFSTVGDILSTMGILTSVGDNMKHVGGYHECCGGGGCSVPWGDTIFCYLSTLTVLIISPTCIMVFPHITQITKDDIPTVLMNPLRASWYPPEQPHGTDHTLCRVPVKQLRVAALQRYLTSFLGQIFTN